MIKYNLERKRRERKKKKERESGKGGEERKKDEKKITKIKNFALLELKSLIVNKERKAHKNDRNPKY